jgi:hypothetical protein
MPTPLLLRPSRDADSMLIEGACALARELRVDFVAPVTAPSDASCCTHSQSEQCTIIINAIMHGPVCVACTLTIGYSRILLISPRCCAIPSNLYSQDKPICTMHLFAIYTQSRMLERKPTWIHRHRIRGKAATL